VVLEVFSAQPGDPSLTQGHWGVKEWPLTSTDYRDRFSLYFFLSSLIRPLLSQFCSVFHSPPLSTASYVAFLNKNSRCTSCGWLVLSVQVREPRAAALGPFVSLWRKNIRQVFQLCTWSSHSFLPSVFKIVTQSFWLNLVQTSSWTQFFPALTAGINNMNRNVSCWYRICGITLTETQEKPTGIYEIT
jgi:hypothetical protein